MALDDNPQKYQLHQLYHHDHHQQHPPQNEEDHRSLQTTNFLATYMARYQHLADPECSGAPAVIEVFCRGDIAPVSISSATIQCSISYDSARWKGLQCVNKCGQDGRVPCSNVYLERNAVEGGTFAELIFQCFGETTEDVDGYLLYRGGSTPGECAETDSSESRNYHVAQLGVQCPTEGTTNTQYMFDDYHLECNAASDIGKFGQRYTCYNGANCEGQACEVPFEDVIVHADNHNFHHCIEALGNVPSGPGPTLGDLQQSSPPGTYTARFQANWQLKLDTTFCSGEFATKVITCLNDTTIANVEPLYDNVNCTLTSQSQMECQDMTPEHFVNGFSGVRYDCVGPTLPETMVEYQTGNSYCGTTTLVQKEVGHLLQLGVLCQVPDVPDTTVVSKLDTFFECGPTNDFEFLAGGDYTCLSLNTFDRNSPVVAVPVEPVTMRTDFRWSNERTDSCFDFVAPGTVVETTTVAPTTDPDEEGEGTTTATVSPTSGPTVSIPVASPTGTPLITGSPTSTETSLPTVATETASPTTGEFVGIGIPVDPVEPITSPPVATAPGGDDGGVLITAAPMAPSPPGDIGIGVGVPSPTVQTTTTQSPVATKPSAGGLVVAPTSPTVPGEAITIPVAPEEGGGSVTTTTAPTTAPSISANPPPTLTPMAIVIPEGTTYAVDYVGRFQQVKSAGCINSNPAMVLTCSGTVQNISTSDPTIQCGPDSIMLDDGRNAILCENTCVGAACETLWLSVNNIGGVAAPYGEVYFTCSGESTADVDGTFIIVEGDPGSCDGTDPLGNSYNLNLVQLGVSCPVEGSETTEYVVDDLHADCGLQNRVLEVDNLYTCFTGLACGEEPCLVEFEQLIVGADPHRFQDCIVSSNGSPVPQVAAPEIPDRPAGVYTATFTAAWFFLLDDTCVGSVSPKVITCTNGSIRLVESMGNGSPCEVTSQSTIECVDSSLQGGLVYECESSAAIPETHVQYIAGDATCDSVTVQTVERALQLGVLCGGPGDEFYVFGDIFLECGEGNAFDIINGANFTCFSQVEVPASNARVYQIADTEIFTDYRWPLFASDICYQYESARRLRLSSERSISDADMTNMRKQKGAPPEAAPPVIANELLPSSSSAAPFSTGSSSGRTALQTTTLMAVVVLFVGQLFQ